MRGSIICVLLLVTQARADRRPCLVRGSLTQPAIDADKRSPHVYIYQTHAHHLTKLRGGATDDQKLTVFALTNVAVYALLYLGMTTYGGLPFITAACWVVWALWLSSSKECKRLVDVTLAHPQEVAMGLAKTLLNITNDEVDAADANPFLHDGDVQELHAERGAPIVIPSDTLLVDCDNGMDWSMLQQGASIAQIMKRRSEIVTLSLVEERTYIRRKQQGAMKHKQRADTSEALAFGEAEYEDVTACRGEPFVWPKEQLLIRSDNGLGDRAVGDDGLREVRTLSQLKGRSEDVTLRFIREQDFCERWSQRKEREKAGLHETIESLEAPPNIQNASARVFKRFDRLMEAGFLAPAAWRRLRSRPLALFGSAFSHVDVEHISVNLAALRACRTAEAWLGSRCFAHLYLTSALLSQLFCCAWHKYAPRAEKRRACHANRQGLGASGAISGVMAWFCIECYRRGQTFVFRGRSVSPLWFWALYVAIDLLGLLRLGLVQQVATAYLDQMMGTAQEDGEEKKRPRGEVGYDAHLGGAIAGMLWHVPSLLAVKRRR